MTPRPVLQLFAKGCLFYEPYPTFVGDDDYRNEAFYSYF